ncbi:hypothetical protein MKEN_00277900 [Mycena kentingensis (nom. inval.)]|nr:hypothetical protein MKEN_00277900 [Mycena kentingensis (nom. inval.)]
MTELTLPAPNSTPNADRAEAYELPASPTLAPARGSMSGQDARATTVNPNDTRGATDVVFDADAENAPLLARADPPRPSASTTTTQYPPPAARPAAVPALPTLPSTNSAGIRDTRHDTQPESLATSLLSILLLIWGPAYLWGYWPVLPWMSTAALIFAAFPPDIVAMRRRVPNAAAAKMLGPELLRTPAQKAVGVYLGFLTVFSLFSAMLLTSSSNGAAARKYLRETLNSGSNANATTPAGNSTSPGEPVDAGGSGGSDWIFVILSAFFTCSLAWYAYLVALSVSGDAGARWAYLYTDHQEKKADGTAASNSNTNPTAGANVPARQMV